MKEQIQNLNIGECLLSKIDDDLSSILSLIDIKMTSYENLHSSYVQKTCEEAYSFNVKLLKEKYLKLTLEKQYVTNEVLKRSLGENEFNVLVNKYNYTYNLDFGTNSLIITIQSLRRI